MDWKQLIYNLAPDEPHADVAAHWDASVAAMPAGEWAFFSLQAIEEALDWSGLEVDLASQLHQVAHDVQGKPIMRALVWHAIYRLCVAEGGVNLEAWPTFERWLGDRAPDVYLLIALSVVSRARETYQSLGIEEQITRDTLREIHDFAHMHQQFTNRLSVYPIQIPWLRNYVDGKLFRLGRLEYMVCEFGARIGNSIVIYRNTQTNKTIALAQDRVVFSEAGYVDRNIASSDWTATLEVNSASIKGHPINPLGYVQRQTIELPTCEWRRVVDATDRVLDMHIPAAGPLTLESVVDSLKRAFTFFDERGEHYRAAVCNSWICAPSLREICRPDSNMVRLMNHLYCFPLPYSVHSGLFFLFGQATFDPATAPRQTSLQRGILDYLASGGRWRAGGMFVLRDDLNRIEHRPYAS